MFLTKWAIVKNQDLPKKKKKKKEAFRLISRFGLQIPLSKVPLLGVILF